DLLRCLLFFFSSRRRHTRFSRDWSSDVCSSDLDILAEVAAQRQALKLVVGFAAETHDVEKYARGKLVAKQLDLIIANQVGIAGGGFESDQNAAIAYWDGGQREFPGTAKTRLAEQLLDLIAERLDA